MAPNGALSAQERTELGRYKKASFVVSLVEHYFCLAHARTCAHVCIHGLIILCFFYIHVAFRTSWLLIPMISKYILRIRLCTTIVTMTTLSVYAGVAGSVLERRTLPGEVTTQLSGHSIKCWRLVGPSFAIYNNFMTGLTQMLLFLLMCRWSPTPCTPYTSKTVC